MTLRILIEQYIIPEYRLSFFKKLSERMDLIVVSNEDGTLPGTADVQKTSFRVERLKEKFFPLIRSTSHVGILEILEKQKRNICITNHKYIRAYWLNPLFFFAVKRLNLKMILWSSDGYDVDDVTLLRKKMEKLNCSVKGMKQWLGFKLHKMLMHWVSGHVTYSEVTRDYLHFLYDVPLEKIFVAYNAVDTTVLEKKYIEFEMRKLKRNYKQLVFVGKLVEDMKRVKDLLHAYKILKQKITDISLVIAGGGPDLDMLATYSKKLNLKDVEFIGPVFDKEKLAELLYSSGIYVLPFRGGLGLNDAMAMGLPLVCSSADGTEKHLLEQGKNGMFFRPGDVQDLAAVIEKILSTPEMMKKMGAESNKRIVNKYNLDNMVDVFCSCIEYVDTTL